MKTTAKAFKKGIRLIENKKTFHLAIHHVDQDIDLNETKFKLIREQHEIIEIKRLEKQGEKLKTVKIVIGNEDKFNDLLNIGRIQIVGLLHKPVSEWIFRDKPNKCFNCQKFGHTAEKCTSQNKICLRCAENHALKDCTVDKKTGPFKCGNCGGAHAAVDKNCPKLISHMQNKQARVSKKNDEFTRIYSDGHAYKQNGTSDQLAKQDQVSVDNVIQFIYEIVKDFNTLQADTIRESPSTFLSLVKHYFGDKVQSRTQAFITDDKAQENQENQMHEESEKSVFNEPN